MKPRWVSCQPLASLFLLAWPVLGSGCLGIRERAQSSERCWAYPDSVWVSLGLSSSSKPHGYSPSPTASWLQADQPHGGPTGLARLLLHMGCFLQSKESSCLSASPWEQFLPLPNHSQPPAECPLSGPNAPLCGGRCSPRTQAGGPGGPPL